MLAQTHDAARAGRGVRLILALVCSGVLAACGPRRADEPASSQAPARAEVPPAPAIPAGATRFVIDPDRSIVTLRVYRAGRLAKLGHNHVITSSAEAGSAWTNGTPAGSGFELRLAVAGLVVDDPAARAAAGDDFPGTLSEAAREGTRRNMLRPEVLDGERHPEIIVRADTLGGTWGRTTVHARVTIKDRTQPLDTALVVEREPGRVVARGELRILQSDFGITPFSIGGGAIEVADAVEISFEIHAVLP